MKEPRFSLILFAYVALCIPLCLCQVTSPITKGTPTSVVTYDQFGTGKPWSVLGGGSTLQYALSTTGGSYISCPLTTGTKTKEIRATNWVFTELPDNANITAIEVRVSARQSGTGSVQDWTICLLKYSICQANNKGRTKPGNWPTSFFPTRNYVDDSSGDPLWGYSWTPSDIKDSTFGVSIGAQSSFGGTAEIDNIQILVYFTATTSTADTTVDTNSPNPTSTNPGPAGNFTWEGYWVEEYGSEMYVCVDQLANGTQKFTGRYYGGSSSINGTINGNVVTGVWWDSPTAYGTFKFTMDPDGQGWTGTYLEVTDNYTDTWNGYKDAEGRPTDEECGLVPPPPPPPTTESTEPPTVFTTYQYTWNDSPQPIASEKKDKLSYAAVAGISGSVVGLFIGIGLFIGVIAYLWTRNRREHFRSRVRAATVD